MGFLDQMAMEKIGAPNQPVAFDMSMAGAPGAPQAQQPPQGLLGGQEPPQLPDVVGMAGPTQETVKPGFMQRLTTTMKGDDWGDFAAGLKALGGDKGAMPERRAQKAAQRQETILKDAQEDMAAEALAAQAAMEGDGWNQKRFNEVYAQNSKRPYDPAHAKSFRDLNSPETGIAGTSPWSRDANGKVSWGEPAPLTPKEQAALDAAEERALALDEYRREQIKLRERGLDITEAQGGQRIGIAGRNADTSAGQLALGNRREDREALGGGGAGPGGMPDFANMSVSDLKAYEQSLRKH